MQLWFAGENRPGVLLSTIAETSQQNSNGLFKSRAPRVASLLLGFAIALGLASCGGSINPTSSSAAKSTPSNVVLTTTSLPSGQVGIAYSASLSASGGSTPYSWSLASGAWPAGLSMSSSGVISGTPSAAANAASLTVTVKDSGNPVQAQSKALTLTISSAASPALSITTASLPNGQVGVAYGATLTATGGVAPYRWSSASGVLPAGLSLSALGVISGTPAAAANAASVTISVTDSSNPALNQSTAFTITIAQPAPFTITTASLPSAQVGIAYSATLAATGGSAPYSWSITSGALPAGLALNATTGVIAGTPTVAAAATALTLQVADSSSTVRTALANLSITVSAGAPTVSVSASQLSATVSQVISVVATTTDVAGVTWTISPAGGSFSPARSTSGASVVFTAPTTAGVYVLTATSVTDPAQSSSVTVGVTDLAGVYTYHNDLARDGANAQEYALTTSNVNTSSFGKLFSCAVDGAIYAQPLWMANLSVQGAIHNVVIVATQHDGLFAFDADATPCVMLWQANLIDAAHGGTSGETPVSGVEPGAPVGSGHGDISPEIGVTGTPVIDPVGGTLYVVSKSSDATGSVFYQRLHAISVATGNEKTGSPISIAATFPGSGDGGSTVSFNTKQELQRPGLALVNGSVYVGWGSHEDAVPFYGWMIAYTYSGSSFTQASVLNVAPNLGQGAIWMSGGAPSADSNNNLYVISANGGFNASSSTAPNNDYGDSLLKLTTDLTVSQYFTPSDQATDAANDFDFGSGGAALLADLPTGSPITHLILGGGKDGTLYVLNRDLLGGSGDIFAWQKITFGAPIFATGAFWNNYFYLAGISAPLNAYQLNQTTAELSLASTSAGSFGFPGSTPSVSASGTSNGIVWALNNGSYCSGRAKTCGPAVLHAYDATNVASELWNSSMVSTDSAGNAVKFTVPTVANGKVYVGTRGNNAGGVDTSSTAPGELDVYGLKSN